MAISKSKTATIELLDQYFTTAFSAPEGIPKLRELILSLAMQGQLVPQNPDDKPARELLKDIEAEKQRLMKEKKLKKSNPLSDITPDEIPYDIPDSWQWVRLSDIAIYNGQNKLNPKDISDNTWLLDLEDIEKDTSRIIYKAKYSERQSKSTKSVFKKGDVLYGKLRPYLNKVLVADDDGVCTTEIAPITPYFGIDSNFLKWLLKRASFLDYVNSLMYGVKMPRLGTNDAIKSIHPLPPVEEQRRIVERIESLMDKCDRLQKLHQEREAKRLKIQLAVAEKLLKAPDKQTFNEAWEFIRDNFETIYSVKENVKQLRQMILQLAVMGKLAPQDTKDRSARELLKDIETEKQRLIKEGKIKPQKPLPAITPDEIPYNIPDSWEWVRLGMIIHLISGQHLTADQYNQTHQGIPYYTGPSDFGIDNPITTRWTKVEKAVAIKDDIVLGVKGSVGKINIISEEKVAIGRQLMALRSIYINKNFLKYFLITKFDEFKNLSVGIAIPGISREDVLTRYFPLPPLEKQKRIVEKVDKMMKLCDELEEKITAQTDTQTRLLNAIIAQI